MDAAEPPRIVIEEPAPPCRDADRVESSLRASLGSSRAPSREWTITVRIVKLGDGRLRAEAEITDARGEAAAHRELVGQAPECAGLARATGVWAALVLDAERERDAAAPRSESAASAAPSPSTSASAFPPAGEVAVAWPAPAPAEKPLPEHDWYLHHDDERRTLEPGLAAFIMSGAGVTSAMTGLSPFVVMEMKNGVFLRPSLLGGASVMPTDGDGGNHAWLAAARFDGCLRVPGLYTQRRGMQLDLCGGAELGFTRIAGVGLDSPRAGAPVDDRTLPHVSIGPSVDLRGELGGDLAVTLRGIAGVNPLADRFVDSTGTEYASPIWNARIELGFSWRIR